MIEYPYQTIGFDSIFTFTSLSDLVGLTAFPTKSSSLPSKLGKPLSSTTLLLRSLLLRSRVVNKYTYILVLGR